MIILKQGSFNQTAYRILMLLKWLTDKPLTFEEINKKFKDNPFVGKEISQDAFWIYLNTLRVLECEISRPSAKNNFSYQLTYHPFNYLIAQQDIEFLKELLLNLSDQLDYRTLFYFIKWIQKVFGYAANKNREELALAFFNDLRISDFYKLEILLPELEEYCKQKTFINISYHSKANGKKQIDFLPQKIFHNQLTFYILGYTADKEKASMLRMDRIESVTWVNNTDLFDKLLEKQSRKKTYIIRMLNCCRTKYESLGEKEAIITDPFSNQHLLVKIKTANEFLLKQKLLETGCCFQVLHPRCFKEEIRKTLLDMRLSYLS